MVIVCKSVQDSGWLAMRQALWPEAMRDEHIEEMMSLLEDSKRYGQFIAVDDAGEPAGFIEAALRYDYVNGTETSPVAFIEGIYVKPGHRSQGFARQLVDAVTDWARAQGCVELASDTGLDNFVSQDVHKALGFVETERVVYFRKCL
ncbi:aminoglycoside 6'-N-acetyltransferase [Cellvibrio mixtus]|uniref:aminoglycoside 6'-N-acetyltransferase n=1 Tax=Cellvibrio mixtus TaxID=39650 RepID=UPI00058768E8